MVVIVHECMVLVVAGGAMLSYGGDWGCGGGSVRMYGDSACGGGSGKDSFHPLLKDVNEKGKLTLL